MINLDHCTVAWTDKGAQTTFPDGTHVEAWPHPEQAHYFVIAHRCGYGDDVLKYCREHELAHSFLAQELRGQASHVLEALAHGWALRRGTAVLEEMAVQAFQRWARANERPIIQGCEWDELKAVFLAYADNEGKRYDEHTRASASAAPDADGRTSSLYHIHD